MGLFQLERVNGVILGPREENAWESRAAFNPGTVRGYQDVHMLYRAVEGDNYSTIGYARVNRHGEVLERHDQPVISRTLPQESRGCEDPRIVPFQDRYFVFYSGFDGEEVRIIMAETNDFRHYHKIGQVGPDTWDKDAMLFPGPVDGKVAFMHRIEPNIQIALFEDLDHFLQPEPEYWERHLANLDDHTVLYGEQFWEAEKIGAGPPPFLTDAGWVLIYHGVDKQLTYRAGAVLLDERNPLKVIARLPYPILEPKRDYEKIGDVNNVVFPQGTAIFDDDLLVFYGGADKVVGLAVGKISRLIDALWKHRL